MPVKMVEVECDCGKKFMAREADRKRGWGRSCSKACAANRREARTGAYARYLRRCSDIDEIGHPFQSGIFGHGQD